MKLFSSKNTTHKHKSCSVKIGDSKDLGAELKKQEHCYTWHSNNENISVDEHGRICVVNKDVVGKEARATVFAQSRENDWSEIFKFTIVPWIVMDNALRFDDFELNDAVLIYADAEQLLCLRSKTLFVYNICSGKQKVVFEFERNQRYRSDYPCLVKTRIGYFFQGEHELLFSRDLLSFRVIRKMATRCMFHGLSSMEDNQGRVCLFSSEYSLDSKRRHRVHRLLFNEDLTYQHQIVAKFASSNDRVERASFPSARHIHLVTCDERSGLVFVGTGDHDEESGIWVSTDLGTTWQLLIIGNQRFRTLAIWSTEHHIYWNMDTHKEDQYIQRVRLQDVVSEGRVRCITPAIRTRNTTGNAEGKGATVSNVRFDHSKVDQFVEKVAYLPYGAQWYIAGVVDTEGEKRIIMSAGPESRVPGKKEVPHRDWNARLFCFSENESGSFSSSEVFLEEPDPTINDAKQLRYHRIDPRVQTEDGFIYFMCHNSRRKGIIRAKLHTQEL